MVGSMIVPVAYGSPRHRARRPASGRPRRAGGEPRRAPTGHDEDGRAAAEDRSTGGAAVAKTGPATSCTGRFPPPVQSSPSALGAWPRSSRWANHEAGGHRAVLRIGDSSVKLTRLYEPLGRRRWGSYDALTLSRGGTVTAFYVENARLFAFGLSRAG